MLDRGIGLLGIALAIIFGVWSLAPAGWPKMPPWASFTGIGLGILLVGIAVGLIAGGFRQPHAPEFADSASLRLHVYPDERTPTRLAISNVWRWYYLRTIFVGIDQNTGKELRKDVMCTFC
jgi:hypothetical protein